MSTDNAGGKWVFDEDGNARYVKGSAEKAGSSPRSTQNTDNSGWHWLLILGALLAFPPIGVILLLLQISGKWPDESSAANSAKRVGQAVHKVSNTSRVVSSASQNAEPVHISSQKTSNNNSKSSEKKFGLGNIKLLRVLGTILTGIFGFASIMELIDQIRAFTGIWDMLGNLIPLWLFLFLGIALIGIARSRDIKLKSFKKYLSMIGDQKSISIRALSSATGTSPNKVFDDLNEMLERGVFEQGYIDKSKGMLILDSNLSQADFEKKQKEEQEEKEKKAAIGDPLAEEMLQQIKQANDSIKNADLSQKIDRIGELTAKIFQLLKEKPEKANDLRTFMNYYLPQTLKILESYSKMEAQGVDGENITEAKQRIEEIMDKLVDGYEAQLDKLFADDVLDITADLQVMENMLEKDGLLAEEDFHF